MAVSSSALAVDSTASNYAGLFNIDLSETKTDPCEAWGGGKGKVRHAAFHHDESLCTRPGCMDSTALTYDPDANTHFETSCIKGCYEGWQDDTCSGAYNGDGDCACASFFGTSFLEAAPLLGLALSAPHSAVARAPRSHVECGRRDGRR